MTWKTVRKNYIKLWKLRSNTYSSVGQSKVLRLLQSHIQSPSRSIPISRPFWVISSESIYPAYGLCKRYPPMREMSVTNGWPWAIYSLFSDKLSFNVPEFELFGGCRLLTCVYLLIRVNSILLTVMVTVRIVKKWWLMFLACTLHQAEPWDVSHILVVDSMFVPD